MKSASTQHQDHVIDTSLSHRSAAAACAFQEGLLLFQLDLAQDVTVHPNSQYRYRAPFLIASGTVHTLHYLAHCVICRYEIWLFCVKAGSNRNLITLGSSSSSRLQEPPPRRGGTSVAASLSSCINIIESAEAPVTVFTGRYWTRLVCH